MARAPVFDALTPMAADFEIGEFRLICSGALYNGRVLTSDWTKSDAPRLILQGETMLWVVSQPADSYPQELYLRVRVPRVTTTTESPIPSSFTEYPHMGVASDFAALLTLLLRRLITVHAHVRMVPAEGMPPGYPSEGLPLPVSGARVAAWPRRPGVIIRSLSSVEVKDYSPPDLPVDPLWLRDTLEKLATSDVGPTILACARLYSQGMQLIEDRPEVAYPLFVATVDTLAKAAMGDEKPPEEERIKQKSPVFSRARELGVTEDGARELALLATKEMNWHGWRFRQVLTRFSDEGIWNEDDLFHVPQSALPQRDGFAKALSKVLEKRGGLSYTKLGRIHAPLELVLGRRCRPRRPPELFAGPPELPPVTWFERVVQSAAVGFLKRSLA